MEVLRSIYMDDLLRILLLIVAIDFVLGVVAALKTGEFSLFRIADTARDDLLFKVVPFIVLLVGAKVAGGADLVIPGLDLDVVSKIVYGLIVAYMVQSILKSVAELFPGITFPDFVARRP